MAGWEVVEPGKFNPMQPLGEGEVSLSRNATLLMRVADLAGIGASEYVILLTDAERMRIGLRAVEDGEQQNSVAASTVSRKGRRASGRKRLNIARALGQLGITAATIAGRYTLKTQGDKVLFVELNEVRNPPPPAEEGRHVYRGKAT